MKKGIVTAILVLAVLAFGGYWLAPQPKQAPATTAEQPATAATGATALATDTQATQRPADGQPSAPEPDATERSQAPATSGPDNETAEQAQSAPPPTPPKGFCERDFDDVDARTDDVEALADAGGLVHIFEREAQLADPYGCADFYLAQGLDVDAIDPRADHEALTGLHFAIQRNDPDMLGFMIEHGADLKKRAGEKDIKPLGYAYYLALNDTRIDRNAVIGILDTELTKQAASP